MRTILLCLLFGVNTLVFGQTDTCIYEFTYTPASCETCCDACISVVPVPPSTDCPTVTLAWSPNNPNWPSPCGGCAGVTYTVTVMDAFNNVVFNDSITVGYSLAGLKEGTTPKVGLELFPNPVADIQTLKLSLSEADAATIILTDITGKRIAEVFNGHLPSGETTIGFDTSGLQKGLYFYRVQTKNNDTTIRKMVRA